MGTKIATSKRHSFSNLTFSKSNDQKNLKRLLANSRKMHPSGFAILWYSNNIFQIFKVENIGFPIFNTILTSNR